MGPLGIARRRRRAWLHVLNAVAEMREALDYRIWQADPDDTHVEADCRVWCELSHALADFLAPRKET